MNLPLEIQGSDLDPPPHNDAQFSQINLERFQAISAPGGLETECENLLAGLYPYTQADTKSYHLCVHWPEVEHVKKYGYNIPRMNGHKQSGSWIKSTIKWHCGAHECYSPVQTDSQTERLGH